MVLGWQRASQHSIRRGTATAPPTVPEAIAEDGCEVVPQFFPGYLPRLAAVTTTSVAPPSPTSQRSPHGYGGSASQRRAGSIRLAMSTGLVQTKEGLGDPHEQRSGHANQSPREGRRTSHASTSSSATMMSSTEYAPISRATSCHYAAPHQQQRRPTLYEGDYHAYAEERRASVTAADYLKPSATSSTGGYSATSTPTMALDEMQPGSYFHRRRGSSVGSGQGVNRSNSGSSGSTLDTTTAVSSSMHRKSTAGHMSSLVRHPFRMARRVRMPLKRNHTTKTVSHNNLTSDDEAGSHRLQASRSTSFELANPEDSSRLSGDTPCPTSSAYGRGSYAGSRDRSDVKPPNGILVESIYVAYGDDDEVKIDTRLVPRVRDNSFQLAYLPPRTSTLTVANVPPA
ncbi:hypothetical protein COEREDRAFT_14566 [Coemansia reversa NRRL 1564]|uniref:Uncharacterized protein n=1 Tax=Coemansia reversa (strain ATCC 12441 / NRRL 1564) TaxID=763665 RepID=A0A2G5BEL1_COERN|nr:hypothetical protein COEREDRAFT_14566 [Coemansia reversa NRRL 1564]|eukprot:PIA17422.1 hypothetical protein COEREDRAFT_14566 [Coemansia reversa NRRL 1564]